MESAMDVQEAAPAAPGAGSDGTMDTDTEQERPAAGPAVPRPHRPPGSPARDWPLPSTEQRDPAPPPAPAGNARAEPPWDAGGDAEEAGWTPHTGSPPQHTRPPRSLGAMELDEEHAEDKLSDEARAEDEPSDEEHVEDEPLDVEDELSDEEHVEDEPSEMQGLLARLRHLAVPGAGSAASERGARSARGRRSCRGECRPCPLHVATGRGLEPRPCCARRPACSSACSRPSHGLLFAEADREDLLGLLRGDGVLPEAPAETPLARSDLLAGTSLEMLWAREEPAALDAPEALGGPGSSDEGCPGDCCCGEGPCEAGTACEDNQDGSLEPAGAAPAPAREAERLPHGSPSNKESGFSYPAFKDVPGPCDPEDLLDGVIFGAKYLGSTQLVSERNPPTSVRMAQAQEAVDRIKAPDGESQPMTGVDLFVSTQRIKVLTADTQEAMMDHSLQTISYIADIGSLVVLMARRKLPRRAEAAEEKRLYKMICHVFHSADAQVIAQAIGQAFGVAYQRFLEANSINPSELSPRQYSRALEDQEHYNAELTHFSRQENCKDVCIRKQKGEILGIAIVESGWGSIVPTVVIANLMHGGPAEKSGELSIGDRLMSVNGTSLVGLPLATCQGIIRELKHRTEVTLNIVHCPPVTTAVIRRPDSKYQLGFCVENGVICSLMRGGIAEKGGIRVGHRIIEINGQSVVATPHEKIIQILTEAVSEVHIKTMPASTYRLLTGQEQPLFL